MPASSPARRLRTGMSVGYSGPTSAVWPGKYTWISALGFLGTTPCGAGRGSLNGPLSENRGITLILGVQGSEMPSSTLNANTPWPSRSRQKIRQKGSEFLAPQFDSYREGSQNSAALPLLQPPKCGSWA